MQRDLALVKPTRKYASQVMHYKQEMLANNDSLDGCAGLEDTDSFDEWIDFDNRLKKKYTEKKKPGTGTTVETDELDSRHRDCFSKMCA